MTLETTESLAITRPRYKVSAGGNSTVNTSPKFNDLGWFGSPGWEIPENLRPPELNKPNLINPLNNGLSNFSRDSMQSSCLIGNIVNVVIGINVPLCDKAGNCDFFPFCFIFEMAGHPLQVQCDLPEAKDMKESSKKVGSLGKDGSVKAFIVSIEHRLVINEIRYSASDFDYLNSNDEREELSTINCLLFTFKWNICSLQGAFIPIKADSTTTSAK